YTPRRSREPAVPQVEPQLENQLIGMEGVCLTKLRPAGKIQIGDDIYSVVTDGRWVQPGEKVRVTSVEGNRIVVEEIPS
ncbi:MAG: NfeD family protein, partial [Spirochaetota bacterium]|nr:NfeD family protein [Spirochaetota bacterium]